MRKIAIIIALILCNCTSTKKTNSPVFIDFVNNYNGKITRDSEVDTDKWYTIKVLNNFKKVTNRTSSFFYHEIDFSNDKKIISIYIPNKKEDKDFQLLNCNYEDFINKLNELDVFYVIEDIKMRKNKKFGIIQKGEGFFLMYLNVKEKDVETFDFSLKSLIFN